MTWEYSGLYLMSIICTCQIPDDVTVIITCVLSCFSHVWLCNPMDCSSPGSSAHGILQARILEWVAIPSSRGSSWSRYWTHVSYISCIGRWVLYHLCHWEAPWAWQTWAIMKLIKGHNLVMLTEFEYEFALIIISVMITEDYTEKQICCVQFSGATGASL